MMAVRTPELERLAFKNPKELLLHLEDLDLALKRMLTARQLDAGEIENIGQLRLDVNRAINKLL